MDDKKGQISREGKHETWYRLIKKHRVKKKGDLIADKSKIADTLNKHFH